MKRFLLLLAFMLTIAISTFAQVGKFKATHINIRATGYEWVGWKKSDVTITWDSDRKHIEINSGVPQIIDYFRLDVAEEEDSVTLYSTATDKNYKPINIYLTEFKDGTLLFTIEYTDVQYSYQIRKVL